MPKIVVLGGGESGCGAAVLARAKGFDVFLSDMGVIAPKYKALLAEWNVPYEEGQHTAGRILDADRVVKSPGIPDKAPMVKAVRERGIPVVSEIEFAAPYTSARTICVTGSNGKTTTTTLTYEILRRAGANVALGGNIGRSFALSVATERRDWYVIELSSFQLDGCCYNAGCDAGGRLDRNVKCEHQNSGCRQLRDRFRQAASAAGTVFQNWNRAVHKGDLHLSAGR